MKILLSAAALALLAALAFPVWAQNAPTTSPAPPDPVREALTQKVIDEMNAEINFRARLVAADRQIKMQATQLSDQAGEIDKLKKACEPHRE